MAFRIELCTAGLLLLLSVLHTSQSAHIAAVQMAELGKDALEYLEKEGKLALKNYTGSVGCIKEPEEHEQLNCSLVHTFSSYFKEAVEQMNRYKKLVDKLKAIMETVESLKKSKCGTHVATCEETFQSRMEPPKNLGKLRRLLELYQKWIVRRMQ